MPICPDCRVAFMPGESHSCQREPDGVALLLPAEWSRRRSLIVFGLLAGFVWSVVPWATFGRFQSLESVPIALATGLVTGVAMTFLMARLLNGLGRRPSIALSLASLPIAAFLYGVVTWAVLAVVPQLLPGRGPLPTGGPLVAGLTMVAGLLMAWPLSLLLLPVAARTTYELRGLAAKRTSSAHQTGASRAS